MNSDWQKIQHILETLLPSGQFHVWIKPLKGAVQDGHLTLEAPNSFVANWVKDRLQATIQEAAREVLGREVSLSIVTAQCKPAPLSAGPVKKSQHLVLPLQYETTKPHIFNWRYSFEEFVVGEGNQLAFAACTSMCRDALPADQLFLSSSPGLGKTHLLQAIGQYYSLENQKLRVGYVTSEEFGHQMVLALKARAFDRFKARYRESFDVLLLEDIHFFQGKEKMQEELLSTIKYLQDHGKKIVFTSSFLPREMVKIDGQLTSQFCSGFLAVIQKPDYTLRREIIQRKAGCLQVQIPDCVSDYVAKSIVSDIRQLESCIKSMAIKARLLQEHITMELARDVLDNYVRNAQTPDIGRIASFVSDSFGLPEDKLKSKSKKQQIVAARNTAFYLARKYTDLSIRDIGTHFNRRHSTVIKGISNVEREIGIETSLGKQILRIQDKLEQQS